MTRIFWDTIVLISGYLFTFGAGPTHPTIAMNANSTSAAPNASAGGHVATATTSATTTTTTTTVTTTSDSHVVNDSLIPFEAGQNNSFIVDVGIAIDVNDSVSNTSSAPTSSIGTTTTTGVLLVKKFVAVDSHFGDCPDSHRHFCIHGACRYLIMEEMPACVCIAGFMGMRCEHADLLAVVATNHRRQSVATVLVLCVIGCVVIMLFCTLLHCWLQRECLRRSRAHLYISSKPGASYCPSESVV